MMCKRASVTATLVALLRLGLLSVFARGLVPTAAADAPVLDAPFIIAAGPSDHLPSAVVYNWQQEQFLVAYDLANGFFSLALLTKHGTAATEPPVLQLIYGEHPALAYNDATNHYLLVWREYDAATFAYKIRGMHLSNDGITPIGGAFDVSTSGWDAQRPAVAFNEHGNYFDYLVVWQEMHSSLFPWPNRSSPEAVLQTWWEVWGQRVAGTSGGGPGGGDLVNANFGIAGNPVTISWSYYEPDLAYNLNMNEYLVVYTREPVGGGAKDVWSRRVTRDGVLLTEQAVDATSNDQQHPSVAAYHFNQDTPYLVAFTDHWNDAAGDVRARLLSRQGQPRRLVDIATAPGRQEQTPDVARSEGLHGYTVVWTEVEDDQNIFGRRVSHTGYPEPAFDISRHGLVAVPCHERIPAVAGGSPVGLAVWQDNCLGGGGGHWRVAGRLLGYRTYLALVLSEY